MIFTVFCNLCAVKIDQVSWRHIVAQQPKLVGVGVFLPPNVPVLSFLIGLCNNQSIKATLPTNFAGEFVSGDNSLKKWLTTTVVRHILRRNPLPQNCYEDRTSASEKYQLSFWKFNTWGSMFLHKFMNTGNIRFTVVTYACLKTCMNVIMVLMC